MNNKENQPEKVNIITVFLNRYYKYGIIIISLIILSFASFLWFRPRLQEINNVSAEQLPSRQAKLAQLDAYAADLIKLEKNITDFKNNKAAELDKLTKILPTGAEVPELFAQMEALIENKTDYDFTLQSISFGEPETAAEVEISPKTSQQKISSVDITLNIQGGDYIQFKKLLSNIEKHLRVMDVMSINFSGINVDLASEQKAAYSLTVKTYYLP